MSLSQKHSGKVLVPWFNVAEWQSVYNLIYTEDKQNWPKALDVMKIWKLRTPLLSAGVEGTLILLEALLIDKSQLSVYEATHIFSTSLVRFLNLCAANSDKQGSFYKTAMKNGLPKWLIGIRHDIAHSHNVPSLSMLEMSLKFCLDWLKEKYWEVQYKCMADLIAHPINSTLLKNAVNVHIHLAKTNSLKENKRLTRSINKFLKTHNSSETSECNITQILEQVDDSLKAMIKNNSQEAADKIGSLLLDTYCILSTDFEFDTTGTKKLPNPFLKKWNRLLNIMHETEITPNFVYKLFHFICNNENDFHYQETASLWIKEIFLGLINQDKNVEDDGSLYFNSKNNCMMDKNFVTEILKRPTPFTSTFIKEIMEYNNMPSPFIEDCLGLLSALYTTRLNVTKNILTVNDLNLNVKDPVVDELSNESQVEPNSGWILIEDTTPYKSLPLGVLPHQSQNVNPLIDL